LYGYFASKEALFVAVVQQYATAHLYDAVAVLARDTAQGIDLVDSLHRFGLEMLKVLLNDATAIKVYRMVLAQSGRSTIGSLFYQAGPSQSIDALTRIINQAMADGQLRAGDARLRARQFLALMTAELEERLFQQAPEPMDLKRIEGIVASAVELFMGGAQPGAATPPVGYNV
jgi:AcrR family transcriptional regulator